MRYQLVNYVENYIEYLLFLSLLAIENFTTKLSKLISLPYHSNYFISNPKIVYILYHTFDKFRMQKKITPLIIIIISH